MKKALKFKPSTVTWGGGLHRKEAGSGLTCLPPLIFRKGGQRRNCESRGLTDFGEVTP